MATLTIDNVTKRYGEVVAVDRVSFEAQPGRILGLLGPNCVLVVTRAQDQRRRSEEGVNEWCYRRAAEGDHHTQE